MKRSRNDRTVVRRPVFFFRRKLGARRSSSRAQKWENRRSSLDQRLAWYRRICTSDNSRTSVYHRPSCAGPVGTVVRSKKIRSSTVWTTSAIKSKISETFCWEWVWLELFDGRNKPAYSRCTQQPLRNKYNVERLSYSPCCLLVGPVERGRQRDQDVIEDDRDFEVGKSRGTRIRARLDWRAFKPLETKDYPAQVDR